MPLVAIGKIKCFLKSGLLFSTLISDAVKDFDFFLTTGKKRHTKSYNNG
jgi:hypothetical protein